MPKRPDPPRATLLHRGEHFAYEADGMRYEGECVWAWAEPTEPGGLPRRISPITLSARSIRHVGPGRPRRLDASMKRSIAEETARLIEASDPTCEVRVEP